MLKDENCISAISVRPFLDIKTTLKELTGSPKNSIDQKLCISGSIAVVFQLLHQSHGNAFDADGAVRKLKEDLASGGKIIINNWKLSFGG